MQQFIEHLLCAKQCVRDILYSRPLTHILGGLFLEHALPPEEKYQHLKTPREYVLGVPGLLSRLSVCFGSGHYPRVLGSLFGAESASPSRCPPPK